MTGASGPEQTDHSKGTLLAMRRIVVPEAEAILDKEFSVLDRGFVRLVDYLGGDSRIVATAPLSYGSGTKSIQENKALIHHLVRNLHRSPSEQVIRTFHAKMPIFLASMGPSKDGRLTEVSGRYSVTPMSSFCRQLGKSESKASGTSRAATQKKCITTSRCE